MDTITKILFTNPNLTPTAWESRPIRSILLRVFPTPSGQPWSTPTDYCYLFPILLTMRRGTRIFSATLWTSLELVLSLRLYQSWGFSGPCGTIKPTRWTPRLSIASIILDFSRTLVPSTGAIWEARKQAKYRGRERGKLWLTQSSHYGPFCASTTLHSPPDQKTNIILRCSVWSRVRCLNLQ